MTHGVKAALSLALALWLIGGSATAQQEPARGRNPRAEARQGEPHPGPSG
jgi:hypothetical protein